MIPIRIRLEGFMSYREPQTLDFEGQALWVLAGQNGAGKSAVFDAITFVLYGRYRGGAQQHAARLINNQGAPALAVTFEFRVGPKTYKVHRTQPRKGSPTWEAFELQAGVWKRISGEDRLSKSEEWSRRVIGLSYEAFVSSVMLLQGQSERLLKATPIERYAILAELIDLHPYQSLHDRVEMEQKDHEASIKSLDRLLLNLPSVSAEMLGAAVQTAAEREKEVAAAEAELERWVRILTGAKKYEALHKERDARNQELDQSQALLQRAEEIRCGLAGYREIDGVLGMLQQLVRLRQQLADGHCEIERLQQELERSAQRCRELKDRRADHAAQVQAQQTEKERCQGELAHIQERLTEIAPRVETLRHIEDAEATLSRLQAELARFPADLRAQREAAQREAVRIEEARGAHGSLTRIAEQRRELLDSEEEAAAAQQQMEAARTTVSTIEVELEPLRAQVEQSKEQQAALKASAAGLREAERALQARLARFGEVADSRECSLCGQKIDEQHAAQERARLVAQQRELEEQIAAAKRGHEAALSTTGELETLLQKLRSQHAQSQQQHTRAQSAHLESGRRADKARKKLRAEVEQLAESYQARIWSAGDASTIPWHHTRYPSDADLRTLAESAAGKAAHARLQKQLDEQYEKWLEASSRLVQEQATLHRLLEGTSRAALREACAEQQSLQTERGRKRGELEVLEMRYGALVQELRAIDADLQASERQQQEHTHGIGRQHALFKERTEQQQQRIAQLPEAWQERGRALTEAELSALSARHAELRSFLHAEAELARAERRQTEIQAQLAELSRQIAATPEDERVAAAEAGVSLTGARARRTDAGTRQQAAQHRLAEIQRILRDRQKHEQQRMEHDRKQVLHKRLAMLLGRAELQRFLMRSAEREIVRQANEILGGLSRARMQLRLRHDEESAETDGKSTRQKALDLEFFNTETGQRWMDIELASGSQCFRVAISLALAMGSYFGRNAHHVESVIIDEGFGCLDKANREDTIEVLSSLQGRLQRIILVSHQDEFSHEFKNGYEIRLEDRTSKVKRMVG